MDFESRIQITKNFISSLRIPTTPPTGFNPLQADHKTLIKHGLPLPPNKANYPKDYQKWAHLMTQALTFIPPQPHIIEDASPTEPGKELRLDKSEHQSRRWAGAVDINTNEDDPYQKVEGSWIVPRAYPLTVDWTEWGWNNRNLRSATWVGIDGYHTPDSHVLQGGTTENCVVSPRQTTTHSTYAWVEWTPALPIWFKDFEINSGDLVTCIVESPDPDRLKDVPSNETGRIMMFNRSTCNYSSAHMVMPLGGLPVEGKTAEWIVEGADSAKKREDGIHEQNWSDHRLHTPYLGATFIYDCVATKKSGKKENLKEARMVDQNQYDEVLKIDVANTAVKENDSMVGIFSAPTYPVWTQIDNIHAQTSS